MTLDLINFVPNTKIKASEANTNFSLLNDELSTTQGTVVELSSTVATGTVPTGAVFWFAGTSVPDGYLLCDGSPVSRTTYATLYTKIGTTYGAGNGSTTFNLPNLTDNRYIQGYSTPGQKLGAQVPDHTHNANGTAAEVAAHKHSITTYSNHYSNIYPATPTPVEGGLLDGIVGTADESGNANKHSHSLTINVGVVKDVPAYVSGATVRPKSLTLLPCIKY